MKVRELMTASPDVVTPEDAVTVAAREMKKADVGAIPVVADRTSGRLVGIVTDRDLVIRHMAEAHEEDCSVRHHMTTANDDRPLVTVRPEDTAEYLMDLMAKHQVRRIPVVDGDGRLVGMVSLADIARELGPRAPAEVVTVLERVSAPTHLLTPTS